MSMPAFASSTIIPVQFDPDHTYRFAYNPSHPSRRCYEITVYRTFRTFAYAAEPPRPLVIPRVTAIIKRHSAPAIAASRASIFLTDDPKADSVHTASLLAPRFIDQIDLIRHGLESARGASAAVPFTDLVPPNGLVFVLDDPAGTPARFAWYRLKDGPGMPDPDGPRNFFHQETFPG